MYYYFHQSQNYSNSFNAKSYCIEQGATQNLGRGYGMGDSDSGGDDGLKSGLMDWWMTRGDGDEPMKNVGGVEAGGYAGGEMVGGENMGGVADMMGVD